MSPARSKAVTRNRNVLVGANRLKPRHISGTVGKTLDPKPYKAKAHIRRSEDMSVKPLPRPSPYCESHGKLPAVRNPTGLPPLGGSCVVIKVPLRVPVKGSSIGFYKGIGFRVYLEVHG